MGRSPRRGAPGATGNEAEATVLNRLGPQTWSRPFQLQGRDAYRPSTFCRSTELGKLRSVVILLAPSFLPWYTLLHRSCRAAMRICLLYMAFHVRPAILVSKLPRLLAHVYSLSTTPTRRAVLKPPRWRNRMGTLPLFPLCSHVCKMRPSSRQISRMTSKRELHYSNYLVSS